MLGYYAADTLNVPYTELRDSTVHVNISLLLCLLYNSI